MEIEIKRLNDKIHFEIENSDGNLVAVDGPEHMGGEGKGMRPMELLLGAIATCGVFDVVEILKKQRQDLKDISMKVKGEREDNKDVKPYKSIHMHFILKGIIDEKKADRAIDLSVNKYCSVAKSLDPNIEIVYSFEII